LLDEKVRIRLKIAFPPILLLALLLITAVLLRVANVSYLTVFLPLSFVFLGVIVMAFGSFFDFGANQYLQNIFMAKSRIRDMDILNINREQMIMSLIYVGIGFIYIATGIGLTFLYKIL
jgi:Ca2+/Na+ antiporter